MDKEVALKLLVVVPSGLCLTASALNLFAVGWTSAVVCFYLV